MTQYGEVIDQFIRVSDNVTIKEALCVTPSEIKSDEALSSSVRRKTDGSWQILSMLYSSICPPIQKSYCALPSLRGCRFVPCRKETRERDD